MTEFLRFATERTDARNRWVCPMCSSVILQHSRSGAISLVFSVKNSRTNRISCSELLPSGYKAWIIADATITPKLADQAQELAFPATYLQHGLAADIVTADELLGDGAVECR